MATALIVFLFAMGATALFLYSFPAWIVWLYGVSLAVHAVSAGTFGFLTAKAKKKKKPIISGIICAAAFTAVFSGIVFLINNVLYGGGKAELAARITAAVPVLFFTAFLLIYAKVSGRKILPALCVGVSAILVFAAYNVLFAFGLFDKKEVYDVKYEDKTVVLNGLEAVSDKRRFIANLDGNHWNNWLNELCRNGEVTKETLNEYVEWYAGTDVTDLIFNTFCQASDTPTDIFSFCGDLYLRTEQDGKPVDYSFHQCFHDIYYKYNIDLFEIWFAKCREEGMNPWISIRMNDCHEPDEETSFLRGDLFYTARDNGWMIGDEYGYYHICLNYAVPEVRQLMLDYIEEQLLRYDVYGLELDWMREIYCFDYLHADNEEIVGIMNGFMRDVKNIVGKAEKKWGHDIVISARLPRDIEQAKVFGFDAKTWAAEKLVDSVTVTPRWATCDSAMPINNWKTELPGIEIYAGIETLVNQQNDFSAATPEIVNGYMAQYITAGADGIYLFNYMKTSPESKRSDIVFNSFGSVDEVIKSNRRHVVTYQDIAPERYEPYHPLGKNLLFRQAYLLPVETGYIPEGSKAKLILGFDKEISADKISVTLNGKACTLVGETKVTGEAESGLGGGLPYMPDGTKVYEFSVDTSGFSANVQQVEITNQSILPVKLDYAEINIG